MSPKSQREGASSSRVFAKRASASQEAQPSRGPAPRPHRHQFGSAAIAEWGKKWYQKNTVAKYMAVDKVDHHRLAAEFPYIVDRIRQLFMDFIFEDQGHCNMDLVHEFYENWKAKEEAEILVRDHVVMWVPTTINTLLGTSDANDFSLLSQLVREPLYRLIRHTLYSPTYPAQWIRDSRGRHAALPFSHLTREAKCWLKIVNHFLMPLNYYTTFLKTGIALVYALMMGVELNIGGVIYSSMSKDRTSRRWRYNFRGIVTRYLWSQGVEEDPADIVHPPAPREVDITASRGLGESDGGQRLTPQERNAMYESYHGFMYGTAMLQLRIGGRSSSEDDINALHNQYHLNDHARIMCRMGPPFLEPIDDDVPTDPGSDSGDSDDDISVEEAALEAEMEELAD